MTAHPAASKKPSGHKIWQRAGGLGTGSLQVWRTDGGNGYSGLGWVAAWLGTLQGTRPHSTLSNVCAVVRAAYRASSIGGALGDVGSMAGTAIAISSSGHARHAFERCEWPLFEAKSVSRSAEASARHG